MGCTCEFLAIAFKIKIIYQVSEVFPFVFLFAILTFGVGLYLFLMSICTRLPGATNHYANTKALLENQKSYFFISITPLSTLRHLNQYSLQNSVTDC